MKKLIASLLTVATVASMAGISAFAADKTVVDAEISSTGNVYTGTNKILRQNEVRPSKTIYVNLNDVDFGFSGDQKENLIKRLNDDDFFRIKTDKGGDDSKMIKSLSVTEKNITGSADRELVFKIKLNKDMTDAEFKINPSVTFTAKENINLDDDAKTVEVEDGKKFTVNLGKVYISNDEQPGDIDWKAGKGGYVAKPIKNDDNEVTWEDENNTLVRLTFESDDDAAKYYPKMSTEWDNGDYAENFADIDAFIRDFVGNPTISSTSRPVVEFFNPFVDDDEELTAPVEDIVIYELVDGALKNVTDQFTAGENDDGDSVFTLKTRTLGTYIFSNGAAAPAEEMEQPIEEPADETAKPVPETGRF